MVRLPPCARAGPIDGAGPTPPAPPGAALLELEPAGLAHDAMQSKFFATIHVLDPVVRRMGAARHR
jgi:hypothetical protein